jgi:RNA polymerase sigma factor (sigma-70 family)
LDREDLIQEGILGLLRALERYDPERGCRFSTYAVYWIRQGIQRSIDSTGRLIGIPVDLAHCIHRIEAASSAFVEQNGYPPTLEELALAAKVSPRRLQGLLACLDDPISLDSPAAGNEEHAPREPVDPTTLDPEATLMRSTRWAEIRGWLHTLPQPDRLVMEGRYGVGGQELSDEEFLSRHGLDRENVRRIERRAIRRLRAQFGRRQTLSTTP